jgi:hypothetical protein
MNTTTSLFNRIAAATLTAGALAIGAMAIGTATANAAETFEQSCINRPGSYAAGAVRGVYSFERQGDDRHQYCTTYDAMGKKLGVYGAYPDYGWYLKHGIVEQVSPAPVLHK